jgi:hypothetical protein|tara:strand:+ start:1197 stop:1610 length:414 start_codon:yes stop_codon:yes gene_type:complete
MTALKSFEELAEAMGLKFDVGFGDWFSLSEDEVIVAAGERAGYAFAEHKAMEGRDGRRVILTATPRGPTVLVYGRNSHEDGPHPSHKECVDSCKIDRAGVIRFRVPCTVKSEVLAPRKWSCTEADPDLLAVLERFLQ